MADWLLRSRRVARQLQIMYGIGGERRLTEYEMPWLPGYSVTRPSALATLRSAQLQLDVYGEVIDALYQARRKALRRVRRLGAAAT